MAEYEKELSYLSKYAPELVLTEAFRCRQFEDGINESIKRYMAPVTVLQQVNFYQLVQVAMKVEKSEASTEHFMENFPKESGDNRNPQSNSRGRSAAPPLTQDRGRGRGGQSQHRG